MQTTPKDKKRDGAIYVRTYSEIKQKLWQEAALQGLSMSDYIHKMLIEKYMGEGKK